MLPFCLAVFIGCNGKTKELAEAKEAAREAESRRDRAVEQMKEAIKRKDELFAETQSLKTAAGIKKFSEDAEKWQQESDRLLKQLDSERAEFRVKISESDTLWKFTQKETCAFLAACTLIAKVHESLDILEESIPTPKAKELIGIIRNDVIHANQLKIAKDHDSITISELAEMRSSLMLLGLSIVSERGYKPSIAGNYLADVLEDDQKKK